MTKGIAYAILLTFVAVAIAIIAARPDWVSDTNGFLKNFVNHEFINVLGITLAVTLASAAQIHLAFNRTEEFYRRRDILEGARSQLRQSAYWLISLFVAGVTIVVIKPIASVDSTSEAVFNMAALFVLLWHVLLLVSLTQLVFTIEPEYFDDDDRNTSERPANSNDPPE